MTAPDLVELIARAKQTGDYEPLLDAIPYVRWLGIGGKLEDGEPISILHFREDLIGNPVLPALHGGTIGALLESAATFRLFWEAETVVLPRIINLSVAYLRPGRPVDTFAHAVITKHGRRVVSVRVEAWQEDRKRPIASGIVNLLIVPPE